MSRRRPGLKTMQDIAARSYVDENGCWIWTGCVNNSGYGEVRHNGAIYYVHRLVYALVHGRVPSKKLVCHKCDVPACCNPDHLSCGSHSTNLRHQYQRGRRTPKEVVS